MAKVLRKVSIPLCIFFSFLGSYCFHKYGADHDQQIGEDHHKIQIFSILVGGEDVAPELTNFLCLLR